MTRRDSSDDGTASLDLAPEVVVSLDDRRSVALLALEAGRYRPSNRDGFYFDGTVQLRPRERHFRMQWFVSGTLASFWDYPNQTYRWGDNFAEALPDLARIALALSIDEDPIPTPSEPNDYALRLEIMSPLIEHLREVQADDETLRRYGEAKIYWSWKYGLGPTRFLPWEARRLGASIEDLERAVFAGQGTLWEKSGAGEFRALPTLVSKREAERTAKREETDGWEYDVALSFAGEQRHFVEAVAVNLKGAGLSVFYDEFEPLWGKDLSIELERVYRKASRYVVVFVSREYVEKAWPNLERQHALSGRIERMDDSVLPARFGPVELPGLPATVSYVDIGDQRPEDLARMIFNRLSTDQR